MLPGMDGLSKNKKATLLAVEIGDTFEASNTLTRYSYLIPLRQRGQEFKALIRLSCTNIWM